VQAKELMRRDVVTVREDDTVQELIEVLVREHIHGVPVLNRSGKLVGMVTQQDIFFSSMTRALDGEPAAARRGAGVPAETLKARDIMTSPAVSATEETNVLKLCELMHRLRIHRVPIVRQGKLIGIVSSLDICEALVRGERLT
jgi:CBS domain-containing protein